MTPFINNKSALNPFLSLQPALLLLKSEFSYQTELRIHLDLNRMARRCPKSKYQILYSKQFDLHLCPIKEIWPISF